MSFIPQRLSAKALSIWCRQMGLSLNAGLPLLRLLDSQGTSAANSHSLQLLWQQMAESVRNGDSLAEAMKRRPDAFPELFISMTEVGEESGHIGDMLLELADYYDKMNSLKKSFINSLVWPIAEFTIGLVVVGMLILILGALPPGENGKPNDILGFGLIGISGFIKYLTLLALLFAAGVAAFIFIKNNMTRFRPVVYMLDKIPKFGTIFRVLALARLTRALHLTLSTGMDNERAMTLSFKAASYFPVSDCVDGVNSALENGATFYEAFVQSGVTANSDLLLMHLNVGEESGEIPETMGRLSRQYMEECMLRMKTLTVIGHFVVYGAIMAFLVFMIFRLAFFYIGAINSAGQI